jgi:hypothetical protein
VQSSIEQAHIERVGRLIRGKKFHRYLINNCYLIAIDYEFTQAGRKCLTLVVVDSCRYFLHY